VYPPDATADPLDKKHMVDTLDYWACVLEWNRSESTGRHPSNLTGALAGNCVARRRRTCKEWNGTGEGNVWSQLAFHIVMEHRARPVINHVGVTNVARHR
jgi:hypothetical protein